MEVQIHWFGMGWAATVLVAALAAGVLVVMARRLARQGKPTGLFQLGAAIEVAVLVLDVIIRIVVSSMRPEHAGAPDWGLRVLDAWTIFRPLSHAVVLVMVAIGMRRLTKAPKPE